MFSKRIYCYQQLNQSDCGITCVRIIARYFGRRFSPSQLRMLCDSSRLGISIKDITGTFAKIGFNACPIRIGIEKLKKMPLPAILYWNQGHFVVLYRVAKNKFYIADPSSGKMRFSEKEICEFWLSGSDTGIAILAEPNLESKDVEATGYYLNSAVWQLMCRLKESFGKNKSWFASIILLTLFSMCADIAVPLLFQKTVDSGISSKDIGLVWILVLSQLMIFLGNFVSSSLVQFIITKLGLHLGLQMMDEYLTKLVGMPMSFFCRRMPSDLIQKMDDQDRIKEFIVEMPGTIFLALISLIVFSSLLAYYCPIILFLLLFATACQIIWNNVFLRYIREIDYSRFASIAKSRNLVYEIVNGISEIKINGAQYVRLSVWRKLQMKVRDLAMRSFKVELVSNGGLSLISRIQDICVTGICATFVIQGNMTIGAMMTVGYIAGRLSQPFADIVNMCRRVQKTAMSVERVDDVVSADMPNPIGKEKLQMGDIHFKGVTFRYPGSGNPDVISNLCLSIPKGSTMAIVGSSGGGKTTLIKLIVGLFHPQFGTITVGGVPLTETNADAWMRNCSVVMQDGIIFSGSILSNIALSDENPDIERVNESLHIACLDDYISTLPMGLMTRIGNEGIDISGGQKQRLLIARAVYRKTDLLVLDEATSSLDAENEARVVRNINSYKDGRTVIIAAHRLSTVKNADFIIFMRNGAIEEIGNHNELLSARRGYYSLVSNQLELAI